MNLYDSLFAGDLNFEEPEDARFSILHPEDGPFDPSRAPRPGQRTIQRALRGFVWASNQTHTHYDKATEQLTAIDKAYVSLPSWILVLVDVRLDVIGNLERLQNEYISDHSPILLKFVVRHPKPARVRPINPQVCKHPLFRQRLNEEVEYTNWDELGPWALAQCRVALGTAILWYRVTQEIYQRGEKVHDSFTQAAPSNW